MLSTNLAIQNAVCLNNMAAMNMVMASDRMLNSMSGVSFGNSQPLKPAFSASPVDELLIKTNETKVTVLSKLIEALNKKLSADIKNSTPKYSGLNYKA